MVGGEVEHQADSLCRLPGDTRLLEVGPNKLDPTGLYMALNVLQPPAAQVVHHTDPRAASNQRIHQVRADK
jgi:hypothetical protein